jgi:hypothetical protein
MTLDQHIHEVLLRLEAAADDDDPILPELRLAVLVHEQPPEAIPELLVTAGFSDITPTIHAVIDGFGRLWKTGSEAELADYVEAHGQHLPALLLFELAHEGRATMAMRRWAELAGLAGPFERWATRLGEP